MITVNILINGQPIFTRSAVRVGGNPSGECIYSVDDGSTIRHNHDDGAAALAHKLLDTIVEQHQSKSAKRVAALRRMGGAE